MTTSRRDTMKIVTRYDPTPGPDRQFDWTALDDDTYDGAEDSKTRNEIGYGATEEEARADFLRLMEELGEGEEKR
jgi:hypothetical protein